MHILGRNEHARRFLELAVGREGHPECAQIVRHHGIGIGQFTLTPIVCARLGAFGS
jgi:hypothetical protein